MNERLLSWVKRLPVDLGQGTYRHTTRSKQLAFQLAGKGQGRRALDLGCGDGFWAGRLQGHGWRVTAADIAPSFPGSVQVDAEKSLPFAGATFDLVWLTEVLEHVRNVSGLLEELRRVVTPGGRLIITTPNSAFWLYSVMGLFGITPAQIQNPAHQQFFSRADIRRLFPKSQLYGFFPYNLIKLRISRGVGLLSPSFIIVEIVGGPSNFAGP
jgi:2-polyprenyl-3-methyl-5-hydroxy-6-metoxy-1,4-benzoquinol methylase